MTTADEIIALERAALDRWGTGDAITYFDPGTESRVDGIINPHVVVDGNMALLTYNLVNYVTDADGGESIALAGIRRSCISGSEAPGSPSTPTGRSRHTQRSATCRRPNRKAGRVDEAGCRFRPAPFDQLMEGRR